jgi:hypothetical protein
MLTSSQLSSARSYNTSRSNSLWQHSSLVWPLTEHDPGSDAFVHLVAFELALIFRTPSDIMDFGPKEVRDVRESKDWQASAIQ